MRDTMAEFISNKIAFIDEYVKSENAATASKYDANANVTSKNIATLANELYKDITIKLNRTIVSNKIAELFGGDLAKEYVRQIESHEIYVHDESSLAPYCVSMSMYPFLIDGLSKLNGESKAPQHLESFCGSFVNLMFAVSSQFAGAVASVEFLMYFDYFAKKDFGEDYMATNRKNIENHFQHVVYAINQPAAARGYQSVFWNISIYDENYFIGLFEDFVFPETFEKPDWNRIKKLQKYFMTWFNEERKKSVLTFPVVTAAMLTKDGKPVDTEFADMCADQMANGNSFFIYMSDSADSLASCCRLRNEMSDNTFSYSLGAGGVSTGSLNVITININRLVQDKSDLAEQVKKIHKYQVAHRAIFEEYLHAGLLPVYDAGFISMDKQYLTIGINGMVEAAEFSGVPVKNTKEYMDFVSAHLKVIYDLNKEAKKEYGYMFNTEFVPAENLGVKHAKWDKQDGYVVNRDCYNSYFYVVEDDSVNAVDKFVLHGKDMVKYLDGGSALHLNLEQHLNKDGFAKLINLAASTGCNYWTTNVLSTVCNECEFIDKRTLHKCSKCGSENIDHATRIIGYLKRISAFSNARKHEAKIRHYHMADEK